MSNSVLVFPDLVAEAPHVPRGIHSQTLYDGPDLRLVLFAFAPGEELSEHTAARPAVVHILDGDGEAVVGGERVALNPGTWFRMPARTPHSIRARTPLRLALYLLPGVGASADGEAGG
jgi:quercetin dioxygenase-like cupin family protein